RGVRLLPPSSGDSSRRELDGDEFLEGDLSSGRRGGARPSRPVASPLQRAKEAGFSLHEMVIVVFVLFSVTAIAAPTAFQLRSALAVRSAAGEVRAALFRAGAEAVARCRNVGLKFPKNRGPPGRALYVDGNGNGIRTTEITNGIDRPLGFAIPWERNDVLPGILTGMPVPDPADPRKTLDRTDDPIRFNSSDICSFSAVGESTPGSI